MSLSGDLVLYFVKKIALWKVVQRQGEWDGMREKKGKKEGRQQDVWSMFFSFGWAEAASVSQIAVD